MRNGLLLALAFAAGYIDTLSYLGLSRVFTANMTGNTVLLGIALVQLNAEAAARSGLALGGFLAGTALAAWIVERDHSQEGWPPAVTYALMLETVILAVLGVGWTLAGDARADAATAALIVASAVAMGTQSAAVHRLEVSGITTTYITGTLTNLMARLMGRARRMSRRMLDRTPLPAAVWAVYLGGAALGAAALAANRMAAAVLPACLIALVAAIAAIGFRRAA